MNDVTIKPLARQGADLNRFLRFGGVAYRDDPLWVAPLLSDLKKVFMDGNPLLEHAEMQLWIAQRDGRDVGRIAGLVDRHFNDYHHDACASFGYFECVNDRAVSQKLFAAALDWARRKGMKRVLGPLNPTTNDESGLLVDGFDSPPMFMMTYNPPYYAGLVEAEGFTKAKDLLAFLFNLVDTPRARFERIARKFKDRKPDISIIAVTKRELEKYLTMVKEVYNEAWKDNWGFVPMTDAEINFMAARLKPLLTEGLAFVATNSHEPVGFLLALPDFNQAFKPLNGRLLSLGLPRFLPYAFGWKVPTDCRVVTLGVKTRYRGNGIEAAMIAEGIQTAFKLGFRSVEASWILENNTAVQRIIELFGGKPYKTYRVYERAL
jgi:GNAT superfamily N-acetyltransferase